MGKGLTKDTYHCNYWRSFHFTQLKSGNWNYWHGRKKKKRKRKSVITLLDSSSTGECIDRNYAKSCWFNLIKLTQLIPVYNVDGTPNEAGSITEVVSLILCHKNHSEWTTFCITNLGKQKLILRHSWLRQHNPEINWAQGEIKMSRCPPHYWSSCREELLQERITQKTEARKTDICLAGFLPEIDHDSDCEMDFDLGSSRSEDKTPLIEEGDCILATGLLPSPSIDIRASSTISQRLAEAYQVNAEALNPALDFCTDYSSTCYTFCIYTYFRFQVFFYCSQLLHALLFTLPHAFTFLSMCSDSVHNLFQVTMTFYIFMTYLHYAPNLSRRSI